MTATARTARIARDLRIFGAWTTMIAQNPREVPVNQFRPEQGTVTEWDLTDGDDTPYGTLRTSESDSDIAVSRRMARAARNYWHNL